MPTKSGRLSRPWLLALSWPWLPGCYLMKLSLCSYLIKAIKSLSLYYTSITCHISISPLYKLPVSSSVSYALLSRHIRVRSGISRSPMSLGDPRVVGELHTLADKAYPDWGPKQGLEMARNQFIQGWRQPPSSLCWCGRSQIQWRKRWSLLSGNSLWRQRRDGDIDAPRNSISTHWSRKPKRQLRPMLSIARKQPQAARN